MKSSKKFDPAKRQKLNNPERLSWIPPDLVWELVNSEGGNLFLDVGAGTGYLTRSIAAHADPGVQVIALDIEPIMVSEMKKTLSPDGNVVPRLMSRDKLSFSENSVDGVWLIALFHELTPPDQLLVEIRRVLRPGGKLVIIDWVKDGRACRQGPPLDHRVSTETAIEQVKTAGFHEVEEVGREFLYHFAITAVC
jgi:ubiquinone/menaquinone biosynthesis C-methylase UbiE